MDGSSLASIARLLGDPTRATVLARLLDGSTIPAGELAKEAQVSAATMSGHLAQLVRGGLVVVTNQGRHRYFRLAGPEVAQALESVALFPQPGRSSTVPEALRLVRTCYNHLAGQVAVELTRQLLAHALVVSESGVFGLTEKGHKRLGQLGILTQAASGRACLDWSERAPHIGGALGSLLLNGFLGRAWFLRRPNSRALRITLNGRLALEREFGITPNLFLHS
jgi:DNA-binding transcriptional ArsR family regulator